jgi:hypothetical protein
MDKCREEDCEKEATTGEYCRLHYIKNWYNIHPEYRKEKKEIINEEKEVE